jgi:hypothetical protein
MMNATTEATKLNFMTDQGSTRDSVSIAWRLLDRRTLILGCDLALGPDPPRKAAVTEFASPAAAPPSPAAAPAAVAEKPPPDGALLVPLVPADAAKPAESAVTVAVVGASGALDQDDRE